MKLIGAHVSASGGIVNAPTNAKEIGANAFAFFLKNQRQWSAKPYTQEEIKNFKEKLKECEVSPWAVLPHSSYLVNLGNGDASAKIKARATFLDELIRCEQLELPYLNFHPGAHLNKISAEESLLLIAEAINEAHEQTKNVITVLESTAGQGSSLGHAFEELAFIIKNIKNKKRVGVCLDTCHMFAAGYDISTKDGYQKTIKEFEELIGFKYLMGMHLNDSKVKLGSHVDRHMSLGKGEIGLLPFKQMMKDSRFDDIPLILETIEPELWPEEIKLLRSFE